MSAVGRTGTILAATAREYVRTPVLLALLVGVPAYLVAVVARVAPDDPVPLPPVDPVTTVPAGELFGTMMAPLAVGLVAGVSGLFVAGRPGIDRRLGVAGYRPWQLLAGRLGLLLALSVLASAVTLAAVATVRVPDHPAVFAGALVLAGVGYGLVGTLAGAVLDQLPGTYVMLFAPTLDGFLLQSPLTTDAPEWAAYLPGGAPVELAMAAAYGSPELATAARGIAVLAVLAVLAALAFYRLLD